MTPICQNCCEPFNPMFSDSGSVCCDCEYKERESQQSKNSSQSIVDIPNSNES